MRATASAAAATSAGRPRALAAQRERDRRARLELGQRALAAGVQRDHAAAAAPRDSDDHRHGVERAHARAHGARRERVGAAVGQRHMRGAEALGLRSSVPRLPGSDTPWSCSPTSPQASPRTSGGRSFARSTPTARLVCESDESAAMTSAVQRSTFVPAALQLVGDAVAAEVVVDERLDRRDAGGQRGAQGVLALVDEEAGALALLGLAERTRRLDVAVGAARDHGGMPLSAATGAQAGCAATVSAHACSRACPSQRARVQQAPERRHRGAVGERQAPEAGVAAVAEQARERLELRRDRSRSPRARQRAAAARRRCRGAGRQP